MTRRTTTRQLTCSDWRRSVMAREADLGDLASLTQRCSSLS
jgi:hypothetical protein